MSISHTAVSGNLAQQARTLHANNFIVYPQYAETSRRPITAQKILGHVDPVTPEMSNKEIFAYFSSRPKLRALPVVKNGKPLGLISRAQFIECYEKSYQHDSLDNASCVSMVEGKPLLVDKNMPIEELSLFLSEAESYDLDEGFIITEHGRYAGVAYGKDLLREVTQMHMEAARYANPLTLLPGNVPIERHIDHLLHANLPFVACYCNLNHFKPYNETYGYHKGDEMIQLTGRILNSACDIKQDFIGHIGGDDFILLMQSSDWKSRCEKALNHFALASVVLFDSAHLNSDGYHSEARTGSRNFHPLTSLSIGALSVAPGQFRSHHEVAAALGDSKHLAKQMNGNSIISKNAANYREFSI